MSCMRLARGSIEMLATASPEKKREGREGGTERQESREERKNEGGGEGETER